MTTFYDFSGGMESAAMLVVDRQRIADTGAIVRWADTGKHFPEMYDSINQIQAELGISIETVPSRISFDEFLVLVGMYEKMGRFDCFWCGNQRPEQALKVLKHYPELAAEWMEAERRKGHSFMSVPLEVLAQRPEQGELFAASSCSCFGGTDDAVCDDDEDDDCGLPRVRKLDDLRPTTQESK